MDLCDYGIFVILLSEGVVGGDGVGWGFAPGSSPGQALTLALSSRGGGSPARVGSRVRGNDGLRVRE